ncbi:MAG: dihydrofolate reductase family protein [Mycobacterium sp.]|nr:dihydrofolate reductase family protein [Mycobacterium sp.]
MNISLDGYVAGPNGELDWVFRSTDKAQLDWMTTFIGSVDTILLGDATYREQAAAWPSRQGRMADLLNNHAKVVFSSHTDMPHWNNSRRAAGNPTVEIGRLKQAPGKDIFVTGGARLARSLAQAGLIDIYHLLVHPVVLGNGLSLFGDISLEFSRVSSCEFDSGTTHIAYRPISTGEK